MRLIGEFKDERQAFGFQAFLQKEGINSVYDLSPQDSIYRLWVIEEEDFEKAYAFLLEWQKNPQDVRFAAKEKPVIPTVQVPHWKVRMEPPAQSPPFSLNNIIILVCAFLYLVSSFQALRMEENNGIASIELGLTPIQKKLLFDYPQYLKNYEEFLQEYPIKTLDDIKNLSPEGQACYKKLETTPGWKGFSDLFMTRSWKDYDDLPPDTLFHDIRKGEIWRLISPVLLHGGLLHILFNMAWLWMLGKQIEQRLGKFRYLILSILIGVIGNVAQYLMSGPVFLGYSGIVVGMVGFIWMRQRMAPWEGYPLQRSVTVFIGIFVLAMLGLELVSMGLQYFHVTQLYANIANTAHIIGGVTGIALARLPYFSRSRP
jgi:GlpG protein